MAYQLNAIHLHQLLSSSCDFMTVDTCSDNCRCWISVHKDLGLKSLQKHGCKHPSALFHASCLCSVGFLYCFWESVNIVWIDMLECLRVILGSCTLLVSTCRYKPVLCLAAQFSCMGAFQTGLWCSVKHAVFATFRQKKVKKRACKEERTNIFDLSLRVWK